MSLEDTIKTHLGFRKPIFYVPHQHDSISVLSKYEEDLKMIKKEIIH